MSNKKIEIDVNEKSEEKWNPSSFVCALIGVICIGIAAYGLFGVYTDYKVGSDIYNEAESEFVQIHTPEEQPSSEVTTEEITTEVQTEKEPEEIPDYRGPWYEMASVNVSGLKAQYPDVVGWIRFENGLISYPVMHSDSNDTYLYTAYNGTESIGGSIFVEATHKGDFSDTHTIIYGHNMKNGSMFGRLHNYRYNNSYFQKNKYFQIFTETEILRYEIFSYQQVHIDSFVYKENFSSGKVLGEKLLQNSLVRPSVYFEDKDKIVTLSTCISSDDYRFVVSAVLVGRYNLKDKTLIEE